MRIIIIGGGGFLGSNLRRTLSQTEYETHSFDVVPATQHFPNVTDHVATDDAVYGDFLKPDDIVFYLRWVGVPADTVNDAALSYELNVTAGIRFFEICQKCGVSSIIFASSGGAVYGRPKYLPIDEQHPINPQSFYGAQKRNIEEYLELASRKSGIRTLCLRISNPYGPGQKPFRSQGVIATFMAAALLKKPVTLRGDGSYTRDYIYIDDLMKYFLAAVTYKGEHHIINVGSGHATALSEIADRIDAVTGTVLTRNYVPAADTDVPASELDTTLCRQELGDFVTTSLTEGLTSMLHTWDAASGTFLLS